MLPLRHRAAAFLASFLVFQLELMTAKALLPLYGGSASVWNVSVAVFQALVFLAALYAIGLARLPGRLRVFVHLLALAAALAAPLAPQAPAAGPRPELGLSLALLCAVGAPFLALGSVTAVLDDWLARRGGEPIYAASNCGALAALAAFPLLLEPLLGLDAQRQLWRAGLALAALLLWTCRPRGPGPAMAASPAKGRTSPAFWLLAAAAPSAGMLAATNVLTLELAAGPLLWSIPLAIYLATAAAAFRGTPPDGGRLALWSAAGALAWLVLFGGAGLWQLASGGGGSAPRALLAAGKTALALGALAFLSLSCHGALAESKPAASSSAPAFYATLALGGWLGSALVALGLPLAARESSVLTWDWLAAALLTLAAAWAREGPRPRLGAACAAALLVAAVGARPWSRPADTRLLESLRNFYGVYSVTERKGVRELTHGATVHGRERTLPPGPAETGSYYDRRGPVGEVFRAFPRAAAFAVVGLGAGAVTAYAEPGERWDFYELDPDVERLARSRFSYLEASAARTRVLIGDARLTLAAAPSERYDLLLVDAFHSDGVPTHLATREALRLYFERLSPSGLLLFHISSRALDLKPLFSGLSRDLRLAGALSRPKRPGEDYDSSSWVVLCREREALEPLRRLGWTDLGQIRPVRAWTDDRSSLLPLLAARFF